MEPIAETQSRPVRVVMLQANGSGHNRQEPRLTHRKPCHAFVYNYGQTEDTQETSGACPCNAYA